MHKHGDWEDLAYAISWVCGWIYFLAWSLSFYPQPCLNFRRRSTAGLTVDFPLLNVLGFASYTFSTTAFLFSQTVRSQYARRHPQAPDPTVRPNDFAFALHALILCIITFSQFWSRLWGFTAIPGKRASRFAQGVFWGSLAGFAIVLIIVMLNPSDAQGARDWATIDIVYAASYVKLVVTCCKYAPQAFHNYQTRSTEGWAIEQVLLDITGGILSIAQQLIDSLMEADWSGVTGNPVKFGLGNVSIFFDVIFIVQHYFLYRDNGRSPKQDVDVDAEERHLLDGDRV